MVKTLAIAFALSCIAVLISSCGGTGGPGNAVSTTIVGRILQVETGGPPNPQASAQASGNSALTDPGDGSFQVRASNGTTQLTVDSRTQTSGVWQFTIPPASGVTDVGDLWIGPERVTVRGTVKDTSTSNPVAGATVTFGGRNAVTDVNGVFNVLEVAYSSQTQVAFWGIVGTIRATNFFRSDFSTQPNTAVSGIVDVGDIFVTPLSDPNPPPIPHNIWGIVSAPGGPQGAIVRLKQGGVDVRVFNVGGDGRYLFFVVPGTYTINATKGPLTAPDQVVTLTQPNEVIRRDFNLQ